MSADLDAQVKNALRRVQDSNPEGSAFGDAWNTAGVPPWQAAIIRLGRPLLLWSLGTGLMAGGTILVGIIEAIWPGKGLAMAAAMAGILKAYPVQLYWLIAFLFGSQALASIIKAWKGN